MQGNLNEIDIRSILQLIELGQRTGQLFLETHSSPSNGKCGFDEFARYYPCNGSRQKSWFIFFLNGGIIYTASGDSGLSRIGDYLRSYQVKIRLSEVQIASLASLNAPEYGYLWTLVQQNIINPKVARSIIHCLVHETLFDLLLLPQGSFIFEMDSPLAPQLTNVEIAPLMIKIMKQVQEWKLLYPYIQSPDQLPMLVDLPQLRASLPSSTVNQLQRWADGKTSLRQLARYLNREILTVAKAIYPYLKQGWVQMVYSVTSDFDTHKQDRGLDLEVKQKKRIVCIDDAASICETVESILKTQGYEAIALTNPLEALSQVFYIQPDLILCDISMPELDGYDICAMLRHSTAFRLVPIIMLTGKDGFIDRVRAKFVGATDYLTKPFRDSELLMLVEKYLTTESNSLHQSDLRLIDSIKHGVKNVITESANPNKK
jgi:twitching motility two-component system response regulator PilG